MLSCFKALAVCLIALLCAETADIDLACSAVALGIIDTVVRCAFDGAVCIWGIEVGGVGDLIVSFFLEALALGLFAAAGPFALYLDGRLAAAGGVIARAGSYMTSQFGHRSSFFLKFQLDQISIPYLEKFFVFRK